MWPSIEEHGCFQNRHGKLSPARALECPLAQKLTSARRWASWTSMISRSFNQSSGRPQRLLEPLSGSSRASFCFYGRAAHLRRVFSRSVCRP